MDRDLIILFIQIAVVVVGFFAGKYFAGLPKETIDSITSKINIIIKYADSFVSWANYFMKDKPGDEKMAEVVKQLSEIAKKYNLDITDTEIQAIAQKAYDSMKAGESAAKTEKDKADALKSAADNSIIVPITAVQKSDSEAKISQGV